MRRAFGSALLAAGLMVGPALAVAQHSMGAMPAHEFGADLTLYYGSYSASGTSVSHFVIGTPVDLRLGFVTSKTLVVEPRLLLSYDSKSFLTGYTNSVLTLNPDLNFLFNVGGGDYKHGLYLTAGAGVNLLSVGGGGGSVTQLALNGGIGTRVPYESGAIRLEAYVKYVTKNTSKGAPSELQIGGRAGLSLWH
ncbi:MAG TPA: hypothetical protein VH113_02330 [Gemmatimonadales bacterium]|jgi:hypothetical protein|nr:hypothetical protein [Gemmatimonadales bacterium]